VKKISGLLQRLKEAENPGGRAANKGVTLQDLQALAERLPYVEGMDRDTAYAMYVMTDATHPDGPRFVITFTTPRLLGETSSDKAVNNDDTYKLVMGNHTVNTFGQVDADNVFHIRCISVCSNTSAAELGPILQAWKDQVRICVHS